MMNTLFHIASKEWVDLRRDGRFRVAAFLIATLLIGALSMGMMHQNALRLERSAAHSESRKQWIAQSDKDPHEATHGGLYAIKPPSPLGLFDPGVNAYVGNAILMESHKRQESTLSSAKNAGSVGRFGALTAAGVLQLLVPLLTILLGFGAFAGERDTGTLRQLLSMGVDTRTLAWGKALGIIIALATLLVPAAVVGAFALLIGASPQTITVDRLVRSLELAFCYALYFGVFVALTLTVSVWAETARNALVFLLAFWVVTSLFVPRVVADMARSRYPAPSSLEWTALIEKAKKSEIGTESGQQRIKRIQQQLLKQYNVTNVADLPVNYRGVMLQEAEEHTNRAYDAVYGRLWDKFAKQNRLYQSASLLSPFLAMRSLSMGLAGSDFEAHRHFAEGVESYRHDWVKSMNEALTQHKPLPDEDFKAGKEIWESVPDFSYQAPTFGWALARQRATLIALLSWLVFSVGLLWLAAGRMKIS